MKTYVYGAKAPKDPAQLRLLWQDLERAHRYKNTLVELERDRRQFQNAIVNRGDCSWWAVAWKLGLKEDLHDMAIDARDRRGCGWGTGGLVEESARQAGCVAQGGSPNPELPQFARWEHAGCFGVQLQHGLSEATLRAGTDTRARLLGTEKRRELWLRIGSEGRSPIWVVFPVVIHRELPDGSIVQWIRIHTWKVAGRSEWSAQFVIKLPDRPEPITRGTGMIAIDIGWRKMPGDEIRVATWADSNGKTGELRLPASIQGRRRKTDDLRSIRDKNFNDIVEGLLEHRDELPEALQHETKTLHSWRSTQRLAGLVLRWPKDEALYAQLEAWRRQDHHLWKWEANERQNVLRARREIYRLFARWLADTYATVVVEQLDLRDFAEKGKVEEVHPGGRPQRFKAVLSELRLTAERAVTSAGGEWIKAKAAWTTQRCHKCLEKELFDAAKEVVHCCGHCGEMWDQDVNAALNLLRAATSSAPEASRSQSETPDAPKKNTAKQRRERGLATRRARRSKDVVQPPETTD
mgnify:CR=1 FL=1